MIDMSGLILISSGNTIKAPVKNALPLIGCTIKKANYLNLYNTIEKNNLFVDPIDWYQKENQVFFVDLGDSFKLANVPGRFIKAANGNSLGMITSTIAQHNHTIKTRTAGGHDQTSWAFPGNQYANLVLDNCAIPISNTEARMQNIQYNFWITT